VEVSIRSTKTMAGIKALIGLAFTGSIGLLFLFLSCALPQYNNWYPFSVITFYFLAPIPILIARRVSDDAGGTSSALKELCYFLATGIVLSAFALPVVLSRAPVGAETILPGACGLVMAGNIVMFLTIYGFFMAFDNEDGFGYSTW